MVFIIVIPRSASDHLQNRHTGAGRHPLSRRGRFTTKKNRHKGDLIFGGADGTQTHDLYDANVALYQLSYNPKTGADKKTRTSKALLPLVPETSASTNSAISAIAVLMLY